VSTDRLAERTADILKQGRAHPRIAALPGAEQERWARGQAARELASVAYLPGGLSWKSIEVAYRELAREQPVHPFRRRDDKPSRPETAARLSVSPATLRRACDMAGRGTHWPPDGL
jgi:hypothetical protein